MSKQKRFCIERFILKKFKEVEVKEVLLRFTALEDVDTEVIINSLWETIRENINILAKKNIGYYELKKHKPWFDKEYSELLDQRKQAKLQWLQDPSEINGDNLNNVRHEATRYFRNKKREYLKDKINELATNRKNWNIRDLYRGIHEFKRGYQPRGNYMKDKIGDLLADFHTVLSGHKNYISEFLMYIGSVTGLETRDYGCRGSATLTMLHPSFRKRWY
jgi:hypothetical protein